MRPARGPLQPAQNITPLKRTVSQLDDEDADIDALVEGLVTVCVLCSFYGLVGVFFIFCSPRLPTGPSFTVQLF